MQQNKKKIELIYMKDIQISKSQITQQTQTMRDDINHKIRNLGSKYYQIKNLFDRFGLHRDILFTIGKQLEFEYKDIKKNIILKNKNRRMKEAVICWFVQNFYSELVEPNSTILHRLNLAQVEYNIKLMGTKMQTKQLTQVSNNDNEEASDDTAQQVDESNEKKCLCKNMKINMEIDNYDFSNSTKSNDDNGNLSFSNNNNFNFEFLNTLG